MPKKSTGALPDLKPILKLACRRTAKKTAQVIGDHGLFRERLSPRFQLALDHPKFGEDSVPFGFQPADVLTRKLADTAHRYTSLQHIHRPAGKVS